MEYTTLGRTGLHVSVMGLGCGGPSRIGRSTGSSEAEQVAIISGTGNPMHLRANVASFARPPLPAESVQKLKRIFRHVDSISGH